MAKKTVCLEQKIENKKVVVGVLGLGYVGLPLAREFVMSGIKVVGFDIDDPKVKKLNAGQSILKTVSHEQVRAMVKSRKFRATADMSEIRKIDAVLICVPTPLTENREPDMQFVEKSCRTIAKYSARDSLFRWKAPPIPGRRVT